LILGTILATYLLLRVISNTTYFLTEALRRFKVLIIMIFLICGTCSPPSFEQESDIMHMHHSKSLKNNNWNNLMIWIVSFIVNYCAAKFQSAEILFLLPILYAFHFLIMYMMRFFKIVLHTFSYNVQYGNLKMA